MREAHLWLVDPAAYYDPPGGLMTYSNDLPHELTSGLAPLHGRHVTSADDVLGRHFALINHQLRQLRTALALSITLNRTLVLPRLLCGLETVTNFAHTGVRCPSCGMKLPYWCPADHVLRMHYLAGKYGTYGTLVRLV
jgi:arabinosyltransferase